jgi:hypothetical protein
MRNTLLVKINESFRGFLAPAQWNLTKAGGYPAALYI